MTTWKIYKITCRPTGKLYKSGRWSSRLRRYGKNTGHLGMFATPEAALAAYIEAVKARIHELIGAAIG
jgi:hypothetical protein